MRHGNCLYVATKIYIVFIDKINNTLDKHYDSIFMYCTIAFNWRPTIHISTTNNPVGSH